MKLTSIEIKFGSIALSKARNIQISYKGFEVEIEEIALKSNFFNSDISNPVQIFIRDVRINKTIESSDETMIRKTSKTSNEPIKQIPSYVVTFFQVRRFDILSCHCFKITFVSFKFTGINVSNISFILLNNASDPGWWLHASLGEFNIDGSVVSSTKTLIFSINLKEIQVS